LNSLTAAAGGGRDHNHYDEARCRPAWRLARDLSERIVKEDPFREEAWRLLMRTAKAVGDEGSAFNAYRRQAKESLIEKVGTELRAMMPWLKPDGKARN